MSASLIEHTPSAYDYPLLIKHLLYTPLATAPEQEIVYRDISRYTYRTLRQRIGRLASGLAGLGVKPGDTVAVMDWDSHRYLESYFAIPMMGAVLEMINIRLSPGQILYTLNHAGADVILCHTDFLPILVSISNRLETAKTFILLSDEGEHPQSSIAFAAAYEDLLASRAEDFDFPDFDENTRATTFYTTGTTGNPKGVYFSHRQLVLHTLVVLGSLASTPEHQRFHRGDVYMPITPMFHVHAWGVPYVATAMGTKQVYPGRYLPDMLLALIQQEHVTFSHCVPTILHMMLSSPASQNIDLSGWKVVIGGSALPKGLAKLAMDKGIDIFGGYGMSETCPIVSLAQLKPNMTELDADTEIAYRTKAGVPAQLVDLRIVDENMQDVPHDGKASGEVVVRAPWLTQGYLHDSANSENLWHGGYLHTNDIGTIDPQGYLLITDRIKDVVKSGGEWISSLVIEDIVSQHPGVSEVAVIGMPDEKWGERPLALVVLKQESVSVVTEQLIQAHVRVWAERGAISKWAVPEVRFVEYLDKTSVGKLDKKVLRQKYG
ncbi:MAG: long-chain fatty acid--CoA ligase [Chloroflexi bacterium 13_1_20CM_54_36]|jgi:fatty-acyl-CoA synthase|nr:MAG: long-chain fatty acid--CoA ligase [Chloroflexi bacterium 13_1_20CM_54_36]